MLARSEELPWRAVHSATRIYVRRKTCVWLLMQKHRVFKLDDIEHLARLVANLKSEADRPELPFTGQVCEHTADNR